MLGGDERYCDGRDQQERQRKRATEGKGEHEGKGGGFRHKGKQQVENFVMGEVQENHREDVRKVGRDDAEGG